MPYQAKAWNFLLFSLNNSKWKLHHLCIIMIEFSTQTKQVSAPIINNLKYVLFNANFIMNISTSLYYFDKRLLDKIVGCVYCLYVSTLDFRYECTAIMNYFFTDE